MPVKAKKAVAHRAAQREAGIGNVYRVHSDGVALPYADKIYQNLRLTWFAFLDPTRTLGRHNPLAPLEDAIAGYLFTDECLQFRMARILDEYFSEQEARDLKEFLDLHRREWVNTIETIPLPLVHPVRMWKETGTCRWGEGYYVLFGEADPESPIRTYDPIQVWGYFNVLSPNRSGGIPTSRPQQVEMA